MRWLYVLLLCSLSACMTRYDDPDDVRFVSLKLGKSPFEEFEKSGKGELIDIDLITDKDYAVVAQNHLVTVELYFCNYPYIKVEGLGGLPLYYYNEGFVYVGFKKEHAYKTIYPYHYHAFMNSFAYEENLRFNEPTILDFNLRETPQDVCLYIDAGTLWATFSHIRSNIVRIPKETLIKFFAEHPRQTPSSN